MRLHKIVGKVYSDWFLRNSEFVSYLLYRKKKTLTIQRDFRKKCIEIHLFVALITFDLADGLRSGEFPIKCTRIKYYLRYYQYSRDNMPFKL